MESMLSTLAFALLIGAQFLAAIVLISKRKAIYGELEDANGRGASVIRADRDRAYGARTAGEGCVSPIFLGAPSCPVLPSRGPTKGSRLR